MQATWVDHKWVRDIIGSAIGLGLVGGAVASLWFWARPPQMARAVHAPGLRVAYIRADAGVDGSTWSPILFSYPTRVGFSRMVQAGDPRVRATFRARTTLDAFLQPPAPNGLALPGARSLGAMLAQVPHDYVPETETMAVVPDSVAQGGARKLAIEVLGQRDGVAFELANACREMLLQSTNGLFVTAAVQADERGKVQHVFVEAQTESADAVARVARALHGGRLSGGIRACRVRVSLAAPVAAVAEAPGGQP